MAVYDLTNKKFLKFLDGILLKKVISSYRSLLLIEYRLPYKTIPLNIALRINPMFLFKMTSRSRSAIDNK